MEKTDELIGGYYYEKQKECKPYFILPDGRRICRRGRLYGKRAWTLRAVAVIIAGYGIYAFIHRDIGSYMLLQNQFVFFDFEEPLVFFLLDYMAVMGLFVFVGHYFTGLIRDRNQKMKKDLE